MLEKLSPDPSLKELQLFWESQFWDKSRGSRVWSARFYEHFMKYFGPERKPRDIFRSDVAAWREWLRKKNWSENSIHSTFHFASRFYRLLNELEFVEAGFNPFQGMAPRQIRIGK